MDIFKLFKNKSGETVVENTVTNESKKKVLVVEDDQLLSNIYRDTIVKNGYDVIVAFNGEEGLQKIIDNAPDLIVLDLTMPVMDGKKMLSILEKDEKYAQFSKIPVIILTAAGTADNMYETRRLGSAKEFLIKSNTTPEQILNAVNMFLH